MIKTSSLPLFAAALVAVAGLAAPVLAEDEASSFNEDSALATLHARGVNASDLQEWNGKIRATVTLADGSSTFQYFDADTLQPVNAPGAGGNTRVLSRLDVGRDQAAPAADMNSLTWVDPDTQD